MELIHKYFPTLTEIQIYQFSKLMNLYKQWNTLINVVSRKDIEALYLRHVLHSMGIAKVIQFKNDTKIMDVGTGGGFPGIPLAILFPECSFFLVDSVNKKLKVVNAITKELELTNIKTFHNRAENIDETFDFVVSRAVTAMPSFVSWVNRKTTKKNNHNLRNGILYLKGGDLTNELKNFPKARIFNLSDYFFEDFFETKKLVHIPLKYRP